MEIRNDNTIKRFHQFVKIERGPINSAIIDLLEGEVFHVPNYIIDKFNSGDYQEIKEFIDVTEHEKLVINVKPHSWIPEIKLDASQNNEHHHEISIDLHIEEGVSIEKILQAFQGHLIHKTYYYVEKLPLSYKEQPDITLKEPEWMVNFAKSTSLQFNSTLSTIVAGEQLLPLLQME